MKNKILTLFILGMFLFSMTSVLGLESLKPAKMNQDYTILQTCDDATYINISISDINGLLITNVEMVNNGSVWTYNFTPTTLGRHDVSYISDGCEKSGATWFEVTSTGKSFSNGASLSSVGILIGALAVAFFFSFLGFKLGENPKLVPLAFLFIVIGIIMIIYSLFLGWTIGSDIIEHEAFSSTGETIFVAVLWLIVAVVLISFIFFFVGFIKELGKEKKISKFGEGFNPITDTYDY